MISMPIDLEFDTPRTSLNKHHGLTSYAPAMVVAEAHPHPPGVTTYHKEHADVVISAFITEAERIIDYGYEWLCEGQRLRLLGRLLGEQSCDCLSLEGAADCVHCRLATAVVGLADCGQTLMDMEEGFNNLLRYVEERKSSNLPLDHWVGEEYSRDLSLALFSIMPLWVPTTCFSWHQANQRSGYGGALATVDTGSMNVADLGESVGNLGEWLTLTRLKWASRRDELLTTGHIKIEALDVVTERATAVHDLLGLGSGDTNGLLPVAAILGGGDGR